MVENRWESTPRWVDGKHRSQAVMAIIHWHTCLISFREVCSFTAVILIHGLLENRWICCSVVETRLWQPPFVLEMHPCPFLFDYFGQPPPCSFLPVKKTGMDVLVQNFIFCVILSQSGTQQHLKVRCCCCMTTRRFFHLIR